MSATTTNHRPELHRRETVPLRPRPASSTTRDSARRTVGDAVAHEPVNVHDLAHLLAAPIIDASHRARFDRALGLLLSPDGADAAHLVPTGRTPDVVRHRIAGRALARLTPADTGHRQLLAGALAILRAVDRA